MTSLREARRSVREELSRTQLLDAAEEVFGRKGFHETTLKEIAEQAEFSVGSVYSFFESKNDLICQIFLRRGAENMQAIRAVYATESGALERLRLVGDAVIDFYRAHPSFGLLALRYMNADVLLLGDGAVQQTITANYTEVERMIADLIAAGQTAGEIHAGDPESLARMWMSLIHTFHTIDPLVAGTGDRASERFSREEFHQLVARALVERGHGRW